MLSYSTKGSAKGELVDKVVEAAKLAKAQRPDLLIDGNCNWMPRLSRRWLKSRIPEVFWLAGPMS